MKNTYTKLYHVFKFLLCWTVIIGSGSKYAGPIKI